MLRGDRHVKFYTDEEMFYPSTLNFLFEDLEEKLRGAASKFFSEGYRNKIKTATMGFTGISLANFMSHSVFKQVGEHLPYPSNAVESRSSGSSSWHTFILVEKNLCIIARVETPSSNKSVSGSAIFQRMLTFVFFLDAPFRSRCCHVLE